MHPMGRRYEIYLWMGVVVGFIVAAIGRRSWVGYTGWGIVAVCIALWAGFLFITSPYYWKK